MDIVFNCSKCSQELAVDETAGGEQIECPTCATMLVVPPPDQNRLAPSQPAPVLVAAAPPPPPPAAAPVPESAKNDHHRQLAVPQHSGPAEVLVKKANHTELKEKKPAQLRTKCIKRGQCVEVGHDLFDEKVAEFIHKIGDTNIVSIHPLSYGAMDTTGHMLPDYGVMIVYRG
jgi:DNA-directed RNA polymerase subunit RPC12/RpoP